MPDDGCPCEGTCCDEPLIMGVDHDCGDPGCSCDDLWVVECHNCGASCACAV